MKGHMDHTWRCGHDRAGMIPRWKEDNERFHRRDIAHAVKQGRSHWFDGLPCDEHGESFPPLFESTLILSMQEILAIG